MCGGGEDQPNDFLQVRGGTAGGTSRRRGTKLCIAMLCNTNVVYNDVVYILERICLKIYMIFIFFHSCAKYNSNKNNGSLGRNCRCLVVLILSFSPRHIRLYCMNNRRLFRRPDNKFGRRPLPECSTCRPH